MWSQTEIRERVGGAERLLADLAAHRDSPGGAAGTAAVQALVDLYGEALARIMAALAHTGDGMAPELAGALASDELISHLLLVHDLHPIDPATRIRGALADLPGVRAELLSVDSDTGIAELRVAATGCGSSAASARAAAQDAVRAVAPEIGEVRWHDAPKPAPKAAFVPLAAVRTR